MSVKLFRDEHGYAVQTEAANEQVFTTQLSQLLSQMIEDDAYAGHWQQVLRPWLAQAVNICCAYRGYKTEDVEQRTLYTAGRLPAQTLAPQHEILDESTHLALVMQAANGQAS
jgi:hypothetical protein